MSGKHELNYIVSSYRLSCKISCPICLTSSVSGNGTSIKGITVRMTSDVDDH